MLVGQFFCNYFVILIVNNVFSCRIDRNHHYIYVDGFRITTNQPEVRNRPGFENSHLMNSKPNNN